MIYGLVGDIVDTIMNGVKIRNGAIIGTNGLIIKDIETFQKFVKDLMMIR